MSAPKNPIVRGALALGTLGTSEIVRAGIGAGKAAIQGDNVLEGTKHAMKLNGKVTKLSLTKDVIGGGLLPGAGGPLANALTAGALEEAKDQLIPKMPQAPTMANLATAPDANTMSPASSIRNRRNFSTLLTSPQGVQNAPVQKKTLLGGSPALTGR